MIRQRLIPILGFLGTAAIIGGAIFLSISSAAVPSSDPWTYLPEHPIHTDHSSLIEGPFETGQDVTAACLTCHENAAHEMAQTVHWTWLNEPVKVSWRDEPVAIGKANTFNNYCIGIQSNWSGCTSCHAGYGWDSADFDFTNEANVDCLVCHDQSGGYLKGAAGLPKEGVDLVAAAKSVGIPTREDCGSCHFNGGGGAGVKHGDLDPSLYFPTEAIDVHMGRYDFLCTDCHRTTDHEVAGRSIGTSVDNANQVACTDCHQETLHEDERITAHVDTVACQTCHIPSAALRDPTKIVWNWSEAGDPNREENPHEYLRIKGSFVYDTNIQLSYEWYDGTARHYLIGDVMDPSVPTLMNNPLGDITDAGARIFPFKIHYADQPYDTVNNVLLQPKTVGEGGYWTTFDWDSALRAGSEAAGLDFSGSYGFADTQMYMQITHMVQPSDNALQCTDCHSPNGRMDWEALGYYGDPILWGGRRR